MSAPHEYGPLLWTPRKAVHSEASLRIEQERDAVRARALVMARRAKAAGQRGKAMQLANYAGFRPEDI